MMLACGDDAGPAQPTGDTGYDDISADAQPDPVDVGPSDTEADTGADTALPAPAPRAAGAREPLTQPCDGSDTTRCLLPWPSNAFTVADPQRPSGLRVAVDPSAIVDGESLLMTNSADGFSRVSPLIIGVPALIPHEVPNGAMRLFVAEPGPDFGTELPLHFDVKTDRVAGESIVVAYTHTPMNAGSEHLVVVTDRLEDDSGTPIVANSATLAARGSMTSAEFADVDAQMRFAYHAPGRAILQQAGIANDAVIRMWDFTTRSAEDARQPLRALRAAGLDALDAGEVTVAIDDVALPGVLNPQDPVLAIVSGRLGPLPDFFTLDGGLAFDDSGAPIAQGVRDVPFRIVIPAGEGDYRVVMYSHGAGGDVHDSSFDRLFAENGAAKVGLRIDGWSEGTIATTIGELLMPLRGGERIAATTIGAIAGASAVFDALEGVLGDALAAPELGAGANPAAGRRPRLESPTWAGGSLGGVVGLIFSNLETRMAGGVLNVPGAAFTHWLPQSSFYTLIEAGLSPNYPTSIDVTLVAAMAQASFDHMDGANWADAREQPPIFAVQVSIGDPVLPNVGSHMVAASVGAKHLGQVLTPIVGVAPAAEARGVSAVTQFRVTGSANEVHGFTARDTIAADAAQAQFSAFIRSLWAGDPVIAMPPQCVDNGGSCDFADQL